MIKEKICGRTLKKRILALLGGEDFEACLEEIRRFSPRQVVNPIFSFFYSSDEMIKWRAVTAMGAVVADLADRNMESARVIMRRLIWNLNDESGGIGWGSPEAMGEIMARHKTLAEEYSSILASYIRTDGNYIEYENLQKGVLWGFGRLSQVRPQLLRRSAASLVPYMDSEDATLRGLAAWAAGSLNDAATKSALTRLKKDTRRIRVFLDGSIVERTVSELAERALTGSKD